MSIRVALYYKARQVVWVNGLASATNIFTICTEIMQAYSRKTLYDFTLMVLMLLHQCTCGESFF